MVVSLTEPASPAARSRGRVHSNRSERRTSPRVPRLDRNTKPTVRIAVDREELLAAYRLVYRRYVESGYLGRKRSGIVYSPEFSRSDSRTLIAVSAWGEITATATIVIESSAEESLGDGSIIPWRMIRSADPHRRLAGVTCLAATDCDSQAPPIGFFALSRFLFQYARFRGYDGLAIAIHPRQLRFYQRICPIVPLSSVYTQNKLGGSLAVACRIDLDMRSLSQVADSVLSWFESPISPDELSQPGISPANNAFLARYTDNAA